MKIKSLNTVLEEYYNTLKGHKITVYYLKYLNLVRFKKIDFSFKPYHSEQLNIIIDTGQFIAIIKDWYHYENNVYIILEADSVKDMPNKIEIIAS